MELKKLLEGVPCELIQGNANQEITNIAYDSRAVERGGLFVCIEGFQTDGHKYIPSALEKGAAAILCTHRVEDVPEHTAVILAENTRKALAMVSAHFYGYPSRKLRMIGVTGTNGKTTTTYLIKSILDKAGRKVGVIGTIENRIGDRVLPSSRTTPESRELQALLEQMRMEGVMDVVMEVSSHSLDLCRVDGIAFDAAVFTNLTQDHLDYHKTMENYRTAKGLLFERAEKSIINMDDPAGEYMAGRSGGEILSFGIEGDTALTDRKSTRLNSSH